jgi:hypothetical protein
MNRYYRIPLDWNSLMFFSGGFLFGVVSHSMPDGQRMLFFGVWLLLICSWGALAALMLFKHHKVPHELTGNNSPTYLLVGLVGGAFGLSGAVIFTDFLHMPPFFGDGILGMVALCGLIFAEVHLFILPMFAPKAKPISVDHGTEGDSGDSKRNLE